MWATYAVSSPVCVLALSYSASGLLNHPWDGRRQHRLLVGLNLAAKFRPTMWCSRWQPFLATDRPLGRGRGSDGLRARRRSVESYLAPRAGARILLSAAFARARRAPPLG